MGRGGASLLSTLSWTAAPSAQGTGLTPLPTPRLQIAEKVGCPLDDTARMAKCLKVTDPRALTLAYKMPLAGMECEWRLLGGARGARGRRRPCSWRREGPPAVRLAWPRRLASRGSVLPQHPRRLSRPAVRSGDILPLYPSGS